jgi:heat shock protein HslJ
MKKHTLILGFLLALPLTGCGLGQPAPTATPTLPPPTQTPEPSLTPLPPTDTLEPTPTQEPLLSTVAPPDPAAAGLVPQPVFALTPLPSISATQVALLPGVPYQPNTPPDINGLPPHLLMTFDNQPVTPDYFNPNEPQARLFPVPAYLDMYAQAGDPYVAERIQQLSQLIAEKPAVSTPPLPVLPGINAAQTLVAQVQYLDFTGGSGVAFLAYYTQDASPLTNQSLLYFFQGLTTDGNWYVSMAFPIDSAVLPDTAADVPADAVHQATEDNAAYLQEVTQALNEAAPGDFTPPLDQLNAMAASIIVQSAAEPTATQASPATSLPAATSAPATRQATVTPTRTPKGFQPTNTRPPAATAGPSHTPTPVQADIVGVTWYWTSLRQADGTTVNVDDPDRYTLLLKADGTVSMRADCNTAAGFYELRNSKLTIDLRTGTTEDCGDDSGSPLFTNTIEGASSYDIYNDGRMEIFLEDGGVMRFSN